MLKYLKDKKLDYEIGSDEFVNFLYSVPSLDDLDSYKKEAIEAYSGIYLHENEEYYFEQANSEENINTKSFTLDKSILNKTIKEVREKNEEENNSLERQVKLDSSASDKLSLTASYNRGKAKNYMKAHWKDTSNHRFGYVIQRRFGVRRLSILDQYKFLNPSILL
ncbi:hypothetical protein [Bacillus swezeyi]|uniref:Uncharacterized protein n=1 Tax=Bacillus swezeyi TaxID=1925020 RepID=A0A5M8RX61_9BACI|nr:hypothetical protein [Bacillus swezeyi]KAA6453247.1 hypothetical protein DX927_03330 [Bacillus swezeyi]KAA6476135.1 hypothetical protein DX928_08590 [Bacillus swezeyi]TYS38617.1 hypothetical protein FZC77_03215 [Bacillus swezeyi]